MPQRKTKRDANISREGTANFEFFRISAVVPAEKRRMFHANKGEYFRLLLAKASHKVNRMTVTPGIDQQLNWLLKRTPPEEPITVDIYVYHCTAGNGIIFGPSDYIVSDIPLALPR